ncbi:MAG: nitroreductase family protein [Bacteroidaceae bacterium]|nr:nitroreductase family protein [Bacteroidaceae bacterium]
MSYKHTYPLIVIILGTLITLQACQPRNARQENAQDALQTILSRTSIRSYEQRPVETEKVDNLLRAAMAAPTAVNAQPWHFVVVTQQETLQALSECNPYAGFMAQAPLVIVVCGDTTKMLPETGREFWIQDASAASENILLAAQAQGLGAVWTALYPMEDRCEAARQALELPHHLIPLNAIVIGYPAEQPQPKDKFKQENITYIN